ncbi:MAG: HAMP domain-containing sensor histidine kinase [Bacteroidota bacterium]|nr:HAMP domain-containing sensor histidine kinase [Bacteroidota bacterium]MDP4234543.1 HAMP domain-containing sensor histidine kinase [Bacteroidota bacterium]MDP4242608.1 HAMP domain-containing sensor histidine kinase [Bacteroidota bacterium]MDP4289184.1 HAMP domain-containing sensor histidine kinase [Bacteroidota bacterium]
MKARVRSKKQGRMPAPRELPRTANIKLTLLITSVVLVLGLLLYSRTLVEQLRQREYRVVQLFSGAVKYYNNHPEADDSLYRMITHYAMSSEVPVILTDRHDAPSSRHFRETNWNVLYDTTIDSAHQVEFLREQMREMDHDYPRIAIDYYDSATKKTIVTNYLHYGNSLVLNKIESLPYIQLFLGAVIVFIGYLSFSYLKRSEQSNIWVGMAKETAHQLGTPLSSLLGWAELLRMSSRVPSDVEKIAGEIDRDIERLNRIAVRFSKIGSVPDLKEQNVVQIVADVMNYFEGRMPRMRKDIHLELMTDEDDIPLRINRELFEWVIENLIKNAYEAIEGQEGSITVRITRPAASPSMRPSLKRLGKKNLGVSRRRHGLVTIDVIDTGKGIDLRKKNDVFRPGYSTKKRGWGLGLSLARRIIQEYHHGRLFVKESTPGKGTTFRIRMSAVSHLNNS